MNDKASNGETEASDSPAASAEAKTPPPPIVGVGASAGGVTALQELVEHIPADSGIAWVLIQHMPPHRPSELTGILARRTEVPVTEVDEDTAVEADHIYVLGPGQVMTIQDGVLRAASGDDPLARRTSIDAFLLSLAEQCGEHSGCALLSGAGTDGTLGLKAIKEAGGLTLTQTLQTAQYDSMLLSATRTGLVDREADIAEMPALFTDFLVRRLPVARQVEVGNGQRKEICEILRRAVGHDFAGYKSSTIDRRIRRRMQMHGLDTLGEYVERMREDDREPARLFRDLLIGVTQFFRDPDAFAALSAKALDALFENKTEDDEVRVWVPGCATGEEVYSLAMLLMERRDQMQSPPDIKLFGSDIDESALHTARLARYPRSIAADISEARLQRFFEGEDGSYIVRPQLREVCLFAQHNLLRDPPFSRIDLISCRNVLIYMNPDLQRRLMPVFHYALRPEGFLMLGPAENAGTQQNLFVDVDRKHRIFRRTGEAARLPEFPIAGGGDTQRARPPRGAGGARPAEADPAMRAAQKLLDAYTPAHVIVGANFEILEASAGTGAFLELPRGRPNANLAAMARGDLAADIKAAVSKVLTTGQRLVREGLSVERGDERRPLTLIVEPVTGTDPADRRCVVIFQTGASAVKAPADAAPRRGGDDEIVRALEMELQTTKERLQSTLEELETSNEELRASNEELSSVNEELQSSNEELETSKEELQSINEELRTVNNELSTRVEELSRANSDLKNLFTNTRIAMLFLDRDFRIRNFTPPAKPLFRLRDHDMGRPLDELAGRIDFETLKDEVSAVIGSGEYIEHEVEARNGDAPQTMIMRVLPYRDENEQIEGAVLTFVDITERKRSEMRLAGMVSELNHRVKNNLASVQAMVRRNASRVRTKEELLEVLSGQLQAMSAAHDILSSADWQGAGMRDLARSVLYPIAGTERVTLQGPEAELRPQIVVTLGLILQELATNAAKYGALSSETGRIAFKWSRLADDGDEIRFEWVESDGPPIKPPARNGFGLDFITRSAQYELRATVEHAFPPEGYRCVLTAPSSSLILRPGTQR